jgi:carboxypeptidase C (cathepsin A)
MTADCNRLALGTLIAILTGLPVDARPAAAPDTREAAHDLQDESQATQGSVNIAGRKLTYRAEAGVMVVRQKDPMDEDAPPAKEDHTAPAASAAASMSYAAYFKSGPEDAARPITFLFNGGPGVSTMWLHMGAFGPKRVISDVDAHARGAPYRIIDNEYSLLDVSDLVFIDAPGTGFSHLRGTDKEKAFFGVDQDAHAFANFIVEFLSRHHRWNSPKFLFGESYGTMRAATLAYILQDEKLVDLNGVIFLGQILNYDDNADTPQLNPGMWLPYALSLPSFAASAWNQHQLPNAPANLESLLKDAEQFALTDYSQALAAGSTLSIERKAAIAARLHDYTGLEYILRADLRINVGSFVKNLLGADVTVGRLDSRFAGPTIDPLSKEADYDPQAAAISGAYTAALNDYWRVTLKFGDGKTYKPSIDVEKSWDFLHQAPGEKSKNPAAANVMTDLAAAMKHNPNLKVQLNNGYYDLATPYFSAVYELRQLPLQPALQGNIETHFYRSGHMVYAHEPDLESLHTNVAAFIQKNR